MVHFISGHGPFKRTLHKVGRADSPSCPCGHTEETAEHVVTGCPLWTHLFNFNTVEDIRNILGIKENLTNFQNNLKLLEDTKRELETQSRPI